MRSAREHKFVVVKKLPIYGALEALEGVMSSLTNPDGSPLVVPPSSKYTPLLVEIELLKIVTKFTGAVAVVEGSWDFGATA